MPANIQINKKGEFEVRKQYPSDITREQFEEIRAELEAAKKPKTPRKYDLYDMFCAILYLMKERCTWKAIPKDYPAWQNVRHYYDIWLVPDENGMGLLEKSLRRLAASEQERTHRVPKSEWLDYTEILDYITQSDSKETES